MSSLIAAVDRRLGRPRAPQLAHLGCAMQGQAFPPGPGHGMGPGQDLAPHPAAAWPGAPAPTMPQPRPNAAQPPPAQSYHPTGRKRALLCACNYRCMRAPCMCSDMLHAGGAASSSLRCMRSRGSPHELKGCINDSHCIKYLLTTRLGFRPEDIVMLTDDQNAPQAWPTRANIVRCQFC